MDILSKTEAKKILRKLEGQFGIKKLKLDYLFARSSKGRIFIINKELERINLKDYNINTLGLYIAKEEIDGISLSIEGSQILGPIAAKNVLVLDDAVDWMKGKNIDIKTELKGYVIVKFKDDFVGCGRIIKNRLINRIPKMRRLLEIAPAS